MGAIDDLPVVVKRHGTLAGGEVTEVDLGIDVAAVRVLNRGGPGAEELWARTDPGEADPDVDDPSSDPVPVNSWAVLRSGAPGSTVVKLKSVGTPRYTLEGLKG